MADSQSRAFWSFLIVVDVLLLAAFGWALTSRLSRLMEAPAILAGPPTPVRLPKAKPMAPVPDAPADAAAPPAAAPEAAPAPAAEPEKPEPPKAEAAKPEPAKPAPAAAAQADVVKAKRVVFHYRNSKAKKVQIEGSFTKWAAKPMDKRPKGEWRFTVFLLPGADYPYRFIVDGKETLDPAETTVRNGKSYRRVD